MKHIKNFKVYENSLISEKKALRSELVGGIGQKAEYDKLSAKKQEELEELYQDLKNLDKEISKAFTNKLSKYDSISDIETSLKSHIKQASKLKKNKNLNENLNNEYVQIFDGTQFEDFCQAVYDWAIKNNIEPDRDNIKWSIWTHPSLPHPYIENIKQQWNQYVKGNTKAYLIDMPTFRDGELVLAMVRDGRILMAYDTQDRRVEREYIEEYI